MASRGLQEHVLAGNGRYKIWSVPLRGMIVDEAPNRSALGGNSATSARAFEHYAEYILQDRDTAGVILRVNSPGGSATASEAMYEAVQEMKRRVPVLSYIESTGASGAYYVSLGATTIMAAPTAIVGSIGVILQHIDLSEGLLKIGVKVDQITTGPFKAAGNPYQPLTADTRAYLEGIVQKTFQRFVALVSLNRPDIQAQDMQEITSGKVFDAQTALTLKLIDAVTSFRKARSSLATLIAAVNPDVTRKGLCFVELGPKRSLLESLAFGATASAKVEHVIEALGLTPGIRICYL